MSVSTRGYLFCPFKRFAAYSLLIKTLEQCYLNGNLVYEDGISLHVFF